MRTSLFSTFLVLIFSLSAPAAVIQNLVYDRHSDQLIIDVAYQGSSANHRFQLTWGECLPWNQNHIPYQTEAHLDDLNGDDTGTNELVQTLHFSLKKMSCRPSLTTIRLNRYSYSTLVIE